VRVAAHFHGFCAKGGDSHILPDTPFLKMIAREEIAKEDFIVCI
jgi:hypothetical protein